jgi:hypothetical protein
LTLIQKADTFWYEKERSNNTSSMVTSMFVCNEDQIVINENQIVTN